MAQYNHPERAVSCPLLCLRYSSLTRALLRQIFTISGDRDGNTIYDKDRGLYLAGVCSVPSMISCVRELTLVHRAEARSSGARSHSNGRSMA